LTEVEIQQILQACAAIREKVRLADWSSSRRMAASVRRPR
jgi:CAI-1 autoinducer synthase